MQVPGGHGKDLALISSAVETAGSMGLTSSDWGRFAEKEERGGVGAGERAIIWTRAAEGLIEQCGLKTYWGEGSKRSGLGSGGAVGWVEIITAQKDRRTSELVGGIMSPASASASSGCGFCSCI